MIWRLLHIVYLCSCGIRYDNFITQNLLEAAIRIIRGLLRSSHQRTSARILIEHINRSSRDFWPFPRSRLGCPRTLRQRMIRSYALQHDRASRLIPQPLRWKVLHRWPPSVGSGQIDCISRMDVFGRNLIDKIIAECIFRFIITILRTWSWLYRWEHARSHRMSIVLLLCCK